MLMVLKDQEENFTKDQVGYNKEHGDFPYLLWESTPCRAYMGDFKKLKWALAELLSWLENHPVHQKVVGSIPGQGTYLGCRLDPQSGCVPEETDWCFFLSLSLSKTKKPKKQKPNAPKPPNKNICLGED